MDLEDQPSAVGIDHGVTLTPVDLLAGIIAPWATGLCVFTLRLSMIAALGLASRPTRSRSSITSWWFRRAAPPGRGDPSPVGADGPHCGDSSPPNPPQQDGAFASEVAAAQ